ncbi:RNI-like protein [Favolaschia claudopus]|uniref:RNI-like protein n=1 Tax=Favolaschia claudopus TaxID=2862362 RepID=A0AAW0CRN6_9AGAR
MAVHTVDFNDRKLKLNTEPDIQKLFENIDLENVQEIVMTSNTIGIDAAKGLADVIRRTPQLKVAQLSSIFISRTIDEIPPALTHILDALLQCSLLTVLDLRHNAFGQRTVDPVVPVLSECLSLEVVRLANVGMDASGGRILANALTTSAKNSAALKRTSCLRELVIGQNILGDGSASAWADAIRAHYESLQTLDMRRAYLREDGIIAIASALATCRDIRALNFNDNVIANSEAREGTRGWKAIADALRAAAKTLVYLDLTACLLEGDGCDEILAVLAEEELAQLEILKLGANDFAEDHYAELRELLNDKSRLSGLSRLHVDQVEDSVVVSELKDFLLSRKCQVIIEDEDEDDHDDELIAEIGAKAGPQVNVDELAELLTGKLDLK